MSVYSKTATAEQAQLMKQFEKLTGFEFMYQDDLDAGEKTSNEAWEGNVSWYQDHTQETLYAVGGLYTIEEDED